MMTDAEYLAALPPAVQGQLVDLVKEASDTDRDDKECLVLATVNVVADVFARAQHDDDPILKLVVLYSHLGALLGELHRAALAPRNRSDKERS